jgi:hypothetical protein
MPATPVAPSKSRRTNPLRNEITAREDSMSLIAFFTSLGPRFKRFMKDHVAMITIIAEVAAWILSILVSLCPLWRTLNQNWLKHNSQDLAPLILQGSLLFISITLVSTSYANAIIKLIRRKNVCTGVIGFGFTLFVVIFANDAYTNIKEVGSHFIELMPRIQQLTITVLVISIATSLALKLRTVT